MNGESFSISEALRFGWDALKRNISMSVGLSFASLAAMFLLNGFTQASQRHAMLSLGFTLLTQLAQVFFALIWIRFALAVHDGQQVQARDLLPDGTTFLNYLAVSVIYGGARHGRAHPARRARHLSRRALRLGELPRRRRTNDRRARCVPTELGAHARAAVEALPVRVVLALVNIAGAILFGIGLLVTVPMSAFASALVYRRLATRAAHDAYLAGPPAPMAV